jgi:hypothetical protein
MRSLLVLQWPLKSEDDLDALVETEERLEILLADTASVEGHDIGSGEMNIFIETDQPVETFESVRGVLQSESRWNDIRVAYRSVAGDTYSILWPADLLEFIVR